MGSTDRYIVPHPTVNDVGCIGVQVSGVAACLG